MRPKRTYSEPMTVGTEDRSVRVDALDPGTHLCAFHRSPGQHTPSPIRTLAYFLGAIDEVLQTDPPLDPAYVAYLAEKLQPHVAEKEALLRSRSEPIRPALATRGQKSAFPRGR